MDNIIECRLDSTCKEIYTGIWQYDYGQILRIIGADLPKAVEVQFSLKDKGGDTLTRIGATVDGTTEVKVPDGLLKNENCTQNYLIYAWIYVTDDTSGNTEYQIILHVKSRPKPEEPTEEPIPEPNIFHETVEAVNAAADRAEERNPDIIEQILARLDNVTEIPQEKVTEAVSTYMEANPINVPKNLSDLKEVAETEPLEDGEVKESTAYEYDGNIFRTHSLTAEQIKADPESYTDYEGDDAPTDAMVEYANLKIDEYTAQLMEEGLI